MKTRINYYTTAQYYSFLPIALNKKITRKFGLETIWNSSLISYFRVWFFWPLERYLRLVGELGKTKRTLRVPTPPPLNIVASPSSPFPFNNIARII